MPLTETGREIMESMRKTYGERAEEVFYRSLNAGTIPASAHSDGRDAVIGDQPIPAPMPAAPADAAAETEEDCDDQVPSGVIGPLEPPPDLEHPQFHPDASAPPEPALGEAAEKDFGLRPPPGAAGDNTMSGWGGTAGGVIPQEWGDAAAAAALDQLPQGGMSVGDILRTNQAFWPQWKGTE